MVNSLFNPQFIIVVILINSFVFCQAGEMYKYKDANGNWVFSDKPPEKTQTFETLQYKQTQKPPSKIKLYYKKNELGYTLHAKNDFFTPIEVAFTDSDSGTKTRKIIPARNSLALFTRSQKSDGLNFQWALGDPNIVVDDYPYHAPFTSIKDHRVTQGFNGKFSHTNEYNKYAIDIAMDVGTYITAVRPGTVVWVKDDYHMSGTTKYFLDKANSIGVLHDDGTFSSYAHILMDTALVNEGDKVELGDKLARSGSSGFSTGPHLHFTILKNGGLRNVAVPFKFIDNQGKRFTPKRKMIIVGATVQ